MRVVVILVRVHESAWWSFADSEGGVTAGVPLLRTLLDEDEELAAVAEETEGDLRSRTTSAAGSPLGGGPR